MKMLKEYLKKEGKEMLLALFVFIFIVISFTIYLKYMGLRMTKAHNLYNEASNILETSEDKSAALELLNESLSYWKDEKTLNLIENISSN
jgi:predicted negative regulator of RcsB-dependent stress response